MILEIRISLFPLTLMIKLKPKSVLIKAIKNCSILSDIAPEIHPAIHDIEFIRWD